MEGAISLKLGRLVTKSSAGDSGWNNQSGEIRPEGKADKKRVLFPKSVPVFYLSLSLKEAWPRRLKTSGTTCSHLHAAPIISLSDAFS